MHIHEDITSCISACGCVTAHNDARKVLGPLHHSKPPVALWKPLRVWGFFWSECAPRDALIFYVYIYTYTYDMPFLCQEDVTEALANPAIRLWASS